MILHYIYLRGLRLEFSNYAVFLSLNIVWMTAKSVDHDEMPQFAAFHLGSSLIVKIPVYMFPAYKGFRSIYTLCIKAGMALTESAVAQW